MKKILKIAGRTVAVLAGIVLVALLAARFIFRDAITHKLLDMQRTERIGLLRAAGGHTPDSVSYRFVYRQDTARARVLRRYFRLDTLAGPSAATWERTLATARFVAHHIPHANQSVYPEQPNATGLWEYSRTVESAFNCRLHSILLHELLLAQGIVNRFVTCLPADSLDNDCHVVNQVWLPERQKWAMIDSDMQAWVSDPEGTPLSLAEMRAHYIAGTDPSMRIRDLLDTKDRTYYRAYWAKNLYWFICWEQTGYDKEVGYEGRTIALMPAGFDGFKLDKAVRTSDAARFWAAPEAIEQE